MILVCTILGYLVTGDPEAGGRTVGRLFDRV